MITNLKPRIVVLHDVQAKKIATFAQTAPDAGIVMSMEEVVEFVGKVNLL